jgi:hypothetical protein
VHPHVGFFEIEGFEKWKAHQMIPVGMGKKKIEIETFFISQLIAKPANTGSRIDYNYITAFGPNVYAGGIAPVL